MKEVNAVIITIGDELLIGQTIDTNSAWIGQELNKTGIWVKRRIAVGDEEEEILKELDESSKQADIIIITGGLGPTADDITKPALCKYFGARLVVNEDARKNVIDIFSRFNRSILERNLKQAEVPDNCEVLPNTRGTAPGMWFEKQVEGKNRIYISLPGVPHEMKGLMEKSVLPRLESLPGKSIVLHKTLVTSGIGESMLAESIQDFEQQLPSFIKLAYLPSYGMVRLRLTCRLNDSQEGSRLLEENFNLLTSKVEKWLVATEDISLAESVNQLLKKHGATLSTAESCTGGYIAHLITSIPGSSEVFKGSVVAYANEIKSSLLQVEKETLDSKGAVSEEAVHGMLKGLFQQLNTDYGIAASGIMGPTGGTPTKPVGTVWVALGRKDKIKTHQLQFHYSRQRNIEMTAHTALTLLFRFIKEDKGS